MLALPATVQAQFNYVTNNGTITITGYTGSGGAVTIPGTINGLPVASLGASAFEFCINLTSIAIPDSVTNIGDSAFGGCSELASATLGNRLASIGRGAFDLCSSLTSITIPGSATFIGNGAFEGCTSLTNATIGNSVTTIERVYWGPFRGCTSLTAIMVNPLNPAYSSADGVLFNKDQTILIECPGAKIGNYIVPNAVSDIEGYAFDYCIDLSSVTIPNSVVSIGIAAFRNCSALGEVTIGSGVTNIPDAAFEECIKLAKFTIPNGVTSIGEGAFYACGSLTNFTIPNSVTSIAEVAFAGCTGLTCVTIPQSVTWMGYGAFGSCTSLTGVYFQGNAPALGGTFLINTNLFTAGSDITVYYLPGTMGWGWTFGGCPTALWALPYPIILTTAPNFGIQSNRFGFIISWATNLPVVVEACTNPANHNWSPVQTNALTGGWSYFSDPQSANYPARFYRVRSP